MALVQAHDRVAEAVRGEELDVGPAPAVVGLDQRDLFELGEPDLRQVGFLEAFERDEVSIEGQRVTERREVLVPRSPVGAPSPSIATS